MIKFNMWRRSSKHGREEGGGREEGERGREWVILETGLVERKESVYGEMIKFLSRKK